MITNALYLVKDKITSQRLLQTHPLTRDAFASFIVECERTFNVVLRVMLPVYRTVAEQNALYAQGRSKPGKIVTNAQGGQSLHNYGLAIDVACIDINDVDKDGDVNEIDWTFNNEVFASIAKKYGIEWGGNWKTIKDRPHFQISFGYTWKQLLAMPKDAQGYPVFNQASTII